MHEYARGDTAKKKKEQVVLNEAARSAFHKLKKAVISSPVISYPDPNQSLETWTRPVLSHKQSNGRYHPVAFSSKAFHGVEVNYHSMKLKFLAMKWSVKHFQTYLLGGHFKVHMNYNPLMYFLTSPNMDTMKQKWINELVKYDFSLQYQKGKNNTVADIFSRISEECLSDEEAQKVLKAVPVIPGDDTILKSSRRKKKTGDQRRLPPTQCLPKQ